MDEHDFISGPLRASAAAGPTYFLTMLAMLAMDAVPSPWVVSADDAKALVAILTMAVIIGALIAFIPALLGSAILGHLARRFDLVRPLPLWLGVGAALGWAASHGLDLPPDMAAPLIVTSLASAAWCHRTWRWE